MSHVQLRLHSVSDLCPHDCVFMLFCKIYILVHAITYEIYSGGCVKAKNECSSFLNLKVMPPLS